MDIPNSCIILNSSVYDDANQKKLTFEVLWRVHLAVFPSAHDGKFREFHATRIIALKTLTLERCKNPGNFSPAWS